MVAVEVVSSGGVMYIFEGRVMGFAGGLDTEGKIKEK